MRITRRRLFAMIAAAVAAKPADKGLFLAFVRSFDRKMIRCGGFEFHPVAFTAPSSNRLIAPEEVAREYLAVLKRDTYSS